MSRGTLDRRPAWSPLGTRHGPRRHEAGGHAGRAAGGTRPHGRRAGHTHAANGGAVAWRLGAGIARLGPVQAVDSGRMIVI